MSDSRPSFDIDFFSDAVALDPYECYAELRRLGPAVWLPANECWAMVRYQSVYEGLRNAKEFSSGHGVTLNPILNEGMSGNMVMTDDPAHLEMRKVFIAPLLPNALEDIRSQVKAAASSHVEQLVARGQFNAVSDLAHFLPLTIVTELVGLDEEGKQSMLDWAAGVFNAFGPLSNERTQAGMETVQKVLGYVHERLTRDKLAPDGWAARLFRCADDALITREQATSMLIDYLVPSLDTTINATSSAIWLFGQHPEQWAALRADRSLIPSAINEVLRLESPIRAFARYTTSDVDVSGVRIEQGAPVLMVYASGNRDEREFDDPDRFDIKRQNAGKHLGFGQGTHVCPGMNLARLEISCLLEALADHVKEFECSQMERQPHNILRGLKSMQVAVH